jgi:hypothetical protein
VSPPGTGVRPEQRFTAERPCPICGGHDRSPRGAGERCYGFLSDDGEWARCTREELAGSAPLDERSRAYVHKLTGDCKCGAQHGLAAGGHARRKSGQNSRIVRTYDYTDERGELLYQTVRFEPKDFRQRCPNGRGGWEWTLQGVRRVPYRLPELLAADRSETVLWCEGEKDTDTGREMSFTATTNAGGAKSWRPEYAEHLRGRRVAVLPHNDKDGRALAERVARDLYGKAASVKVVELPGVPARGGDLADYRDGGGTREDLERVIGRTLEWTPPEARDDGRVLIGRVIREGIEPPAVLVDDVVLEGRTHAIYGPSGHGKTYVLLWLALRVLERGGPVIIFDNENYAPIISERLEQLGADPDALDRLLYYYPDPELPTTNEGRARYEAMLDRIRPALVCFDSWISFLAVNGLDENSSNDISTFSAHYLLPARRRGVTTLVLDHVPHDGSHARGSTRKRDEVDVMWKLTRTQSFDRDRVGSLALNRIKDREGWLPQTVTFSIGGDERGGFVCSRSSGTIETEDEEGLKDSERKSLEALEAFAPSGAKTVEWQKAALDFGVARRTFYRAKDGLWRKGRLSLQNGRYHPKGATGAKQVPRHQMAPAPDEVPQVPPPNRVAPDGTGGQEEGFSDHESWEETF